MLDRFETCLSILSLYDNKLPYCVCEYFCLLFKPFIVCKIPVRHKNLFGPVSQYNRNVTYRFETISSNDNELKYVRLKGMTITFKKIDEAEFAANFSGLIYASAPNSKIDWSDKYIETPNGDVGKCTIEF